MPASGLLPYYFIGIAVFRQRKNICAVIFLMKAIRFLLLPVFAFTSCFSELKAQVASYAEGGYLQIPLKKDGNFIASHIPGFSVAISGLEISLYAGQFRQKEFPDSALLNVNGGFWTMGYIWRSKPKENLKRFHYTLGGGIGQYGIGENNGLQVNLHPGIQVNLTRSVSLAASVYAGYNFFGKDRLENGLLYENDYYKSTRGFMLLPSLTLRLNTNPLSVMGDKFEHSSYWGGGMVEHESTSREGDYIVTRSYKTYLPAGEYVTDAIITSNNYVNIYPKLIVSTMKNDRAPSRAAGGGIALRLGILALDVEYLSGRVGFHENGGYGSNQDYWKIRRTTVGMGINFFNIPFPFKGPSLIRFIFGARLGKINLESNRPPLQNPAPGTSANPENLVKHKYVGPFWVIEFGTLGLHFELINNKESGHGTGMLIGATYLIPLPVGR